MRWRALAGLLLAGLLSLPSAQAQVWGCPTRAGGWVQCLQTSVPPGVNLDFAAGQYSSLGNASCVSAATCLTTVRASGGTDLLPTSPSGFAYTTFANDAARITAGQGLLVEEGRTNSLLNSTTPATQTTGSINCASPGCTLWVNGAGSAIASAGSATGCSGFAAATNGAPNTFICTGAGTITVTVSGALNAFQLEAGGFGTSLIVTAGAAVARAADVVSLTSPPTFGSAYSLYAKGTPLSPDSNSAPQVIAATDDGTTASRMVAYRVSAVLTLNISAGGVGLLTYQPSSWAQGTGGAVGMSYVSGAQAAVFSGGAVSTATSALVPAAFTEVSLGTETGTFFWDGFISRITLWPTTMLPAAQLQAITQ